MTSAMLFAAKKVEHDSKSQLFLEKANIWNDRETQRHSKGQTAPYQARVSDIEPCPWISPNWEIKHDIPALVEELKGIDPEELLASCGVPVVVTFEDGTKERDMPDWCFLHLFPNKRMGCVSRDGVRVNTRLLNMKKGVVMYERTFGKPIKFKVTDDAKKKLATLLVCAGRLNGVGTRSVTSSKGSQSKSLQCLPSQSSSARYVACGSYRGTVAAAIEDRADFEAVAHYLEIIRVVKRRVVLYSQLSLTSPQTLETFRFNHGFGHKVRDKRIILQNLS
eukprot:g57459.t1